jgi:pSer/pThr/pTyr-binding forkhead associated (FHA) protein
LTWRDGRWWLRDAGSTNGTLLNQQPLVEGEIAIDYGDVVGVGRLQLKLTP